jgi:hypothetical protein
LIFSWLTTLAGSFAGNMSYRVREEQLLAHIMVNRERALTLKVKK